MRGDSPHTGIRLSKSLLFVLLALSVYAGGIQAAYASYLAYVLCFTLEFTVNGLGPGLATLGVISVGIAATMGKVSMGMAVTVAVGISILFGCIQLSYWILGTGIPC